MKYPQTAGTAGSGSQAEEEDPFQEPQMGVGTGVGYDAATRNEIGRESTCHPSQSGSSTIRVPFRCLKEFLWRDSSQFRQEQY